jgi:hypothetical protein
MSNCTRGERCLSENRCRVDDGDRDATRPAHPPAAAGTSDSQARVPLHACADGPHTFRSCQGPTRSLGQPVEPPPRRTSASLDFAWERLILAQARPDGGCRRSGGDLHRHRHAKEPAIPFGGQAEFGTLDACEVPQRNNLERHALCGSRDSPRAGHLAPDHQRMLERHCSAGTGCTMVGPCGTACRSRYDTRYSS